LSSESSLTRSQPSFRNFSSLSSPRTILIFFRMRVVLDWRFSLSSSRERAGFDYPSACCCCGITDTRVYSLVAYIIYWEIIWRYHILGNCMEVPCPLSPSELAIMLTGEQYSPPRAG
jgi:hypothetical protein